MMTIGKFAKLITLDCAFKQYKAKKAEAIFSGVKVSPEERERVRRTFPEFTFNVWCDQLKQNGYRIV